MYTSKVNKPMKVTTLSLLLTLLVTLFIATTLSSILITTTTITSQNSQNSSPLTFTGTSLPNGATTLNLSIDDSLAGTHALSCRLISAAQSQFEMTTPDKAPVLKMTGEGLEQASFITGAFSNEFSLISFSLDLPSGIPTQFSLQNTVIKLRAIEGIPVLGDEMDVSCTLGGDEPVQVTVPSPTTKSIPYTVIVKSSRTELEHSPVALSGIFDTTSAIVEDITGFSISIPPSPGNQIKWLIDPEAGISVTVAGTKTLGTYDKDNGVVEFPTAVIPHVEGVEFVMEGIYVQLIDPTIPATDPTIQLSIPSFRPEPFQHVILPPGEGGIVTIITPDAVLETNGAVSFEGFMNTGTCTTPGTSLECTLSSTAGGIQYALAEGFTVPIIVIGGVKYGGEITPDGKTVSFTELSIPPSRNNIPFYFLNTAVIHTPGEPAPTVPSAKCTFADWNITSEFGIPKPTATAVPKATISLGSERINDVVKIAGTLTSEFGGFDTFGLSCKPTDTTQLRLRRSNNGLLPNITVEPGFDTAGRFNPQTESVEFPSVPLIGTGPTFRFSISNIYVTLQTGLATTTNPTLTCRIAELKSDIPPLTIPPPKSDVNMPMFRSMVDVKKRTRFEGTFNKNAFTTDETSFTISINTSPSPNAIHFDFSRKAGTYNAHFTTKKPLNVPGTVNEGLNELKYAIPKQNEGADEDVVMTLDPFLFLVLSKPTEESELPTSASITFTTAEWIDEYDLVLPESESASDTFDVTFASTKSTKPVGYVIPSFTLPKTPIVSFQNVNGDDGDDDDDEDVFYDIIISLEESHVSDQNIKCYSFLIHDPDYQKDSSNPEPPQVIPMTIGGKKHSCPLSDHKTIICKEAIKGGSEEAIEITMDNTFLILSGKDTKCSSKKPKPRFGVSIEAFSDNTISGDIDLAPTATGDWETNDWAKEVLPSLESSLNFKNFVQFRTVVDGKNKTNDAHGITFELTNPNFLFLVHNPEYDGRNTTLPPKDLYPTLQIGDNVFLNGTLSETKNLLTFPDAILTKQNFNNTILFTNVFLIKAKPQPEPEPAPIPPTPSSLSLLLDFGDDDNIKIKVTIADWDVNNAERSLQHIPTQDDDWAEKEPKKKGGLSGAEIFLIVMLVFFLIALIFVLVFKFILPAYNQKNSKRATGERQALRPKEGELTATSTSDGEPQEKPKKKKSSSRR